VSIDGNADGVRVSIEDNGPGIPEAYASRIFDKFFRVPRGNEHSVKGYGLGLSYAAQIMKLHNGSITMRPSPGSGCIFTLQFRKDIA
jgi:signal transduction histidine kinase